jgi:hypothetical protein
MIHELAYTLVWGKPLIMYGGIATLLSFMFTAVIGFLNFHGNHKIPFKWHPRMVIISFILAFGHGLMGLSVYFNF